MCFYPKDREFGRSGFAPWARQGRGWFPANLKLSCKGSLESENEASEPISEEQRGGEGQKRKKASRINLNCNKIIVRIEISTFGIDFFPSDKRLKL